jgi:putative acetyltransferase
MLEDAIDIARSLGFRRITLETNEILVEAIGLYRSYGFTASTREQFSAQCNYAMVLELTE